MARVFFDDDADLAHLASRTVGILGYGNQGRSEALNLRDSGVGVIVGSPRDSSAERARTDGFEVREISAAAEEADILFMLVPDEAMPTVFEHDVLEAIRPGMVLNFASGYNITYRRIKPPPDVDVTLVAPRMIGKGVRDTFLRGTGFPSLVGVYQDASGKAWDLALAIAKGIGSTRMGAVESSFEEETLVDLFSEQSGDLYLFRLMFEVLVEAGCDPDVVLLELYASGELSEMYAAARDMGLWGQLRLHSRTSQFGQQVTARRHVQAEAVRAQLRGVVEHIRSGAFAEEWESDQRDGCTQLVGATNENLRHPMQDAENRLYRLLGRRRTPLKSADWLTEDSASSDV